MLTLVTNLSSDLTLDIPINQKHDFIPKSESIKKFIDYEINRILTQSKFEDKDIEHVSFIPKENFLLSPHFNNQPTYQNAGFTNFYITGTNIYTQESYYIFDLYDSFVDNNQILLTRNFVKMSKIVESLTTTINFDVSKKIVKEFINIYIPSYFIDSKTDEFYLKISFFNALNGSFRFFECSSTEKGSMKNYFKIKIDKTNKTYTFLNGDIINNTPKTYKISQVFEVEKEKNNINNNTIQKLTPNLKKKKTITSKGTFI
jgi:hypothetical protein